ncbi:MAG: metallophosphoesterase [Clostridia bacterium]|nr:metallophosphoesterase [Clostridia bacterium]
MLYVTSDLHGYPLPRFLRLLDKANFSATDQLIVLGDVIDRYGDGGIMTLRWMMSQPNTWLLMGNHEAMLLSCSFLFDTITDQSLAAMNNGKIELLSAWMMNGASPTLASLRALFHEDPEVANALIRYLRDAPLYQLLEVEGRRYVLTHAGLGGFSPKKLLSEYTADELLWHRPLPDEEYFSDATVIFGHTSTDYYGHQYANHLLRTPTWIDIDTGAGQGRHPMLLRLGDEAAFYVEG